VRLGWLCDVHLNFLERRRLLRFLDTLRSREVDAWLLGGDIGEADSVVHYLRALEGAMSGTIYFTLGNHDFYGGSLSGTRERVRRLAEGSERLVWLTATEPRLLEGDVALVGDDGWADARFGDAHGTPVMLNDFFLIEELAGHSRPELVRTLQVLGDQAAARLAPKLEEAAASSS
jgi:hypothetical protein